MDIKSKLKSEYKMLRKEVSRFEYALWWFGRILMGYIFVISIVKKAESGDILILGIDFASMFALTLFHLLPKKIFLSRIDFKMQDIVLVVVILTGFFGKYLAFYENHEYFNALLHVFVCFLTVFAGYKITIALKNDDTNLEPVIATVCGFGLAFFALVSCEIFEFICDQFFNGNTQNWGYIPSAKYLAVFPTDPRRFPLLDTIIDLVSGTVGSLLGGFALFIYEYVKQKKAKLTLLKNRVNEAEKLGMELGSQYVG